ncbi:MAG TPA: FAD-dependent oxidoreductase [Thermoplasmataceae archaeon]|nr:FAD-dependent oxidoreductase [Thermoplasmataceae archaeon]
MESKKYDVIIIGGASAGLTAALYTGRQGLRTLVITKDIGGQALLTNDIQNYPGYEQIGGFELMNKFQEQVTKYGVEFAYDEVTGVEKNEDPGFQLTTPFASYSSEALILAFGKTPRDLNVPGEEQFKGRGVSYCAVCDGPLFKGTKVAVVGNGDQAIEAANYLSGITEHVYIVQSSKKPFGDEEMIEALKRSGKVSFMNGTKVSSIEGDFSANSIKVMNGSSKEGTVEVSGIFVENGYITKTGFVKELVDLNKQGEIIVDNHCRTSVDGIFAAGDVTDVPYKQAVISAGQGATAALSAYNYIQKKRGKPPAKNDWKALKVS